MSYTAFVLDECTRSALLAEYPPMYPEVVAHHVTFAMGELPHLLIIDPIIQIYGRVHDDTIEAMVVTVNGVSFNNITKAKYHITWSYDKSSGAKPKDSKNLIHEPSIIKHVILSGQMKICK